MNILRVTNSQKINQHVDAIMQFPFQSAKVIDKISYSGNKYVLKLISFCIHDVNH